MFSYTNMRILCSQSANVILSDCNGSTSRELTFMLNRVSGLSLPYCLMASAYVMTGKGVPGAGLSSGQQYDNRPSTNCITPFSSTNDISTSNWCGNKRAVCVSRVVWKLDQSWQARMRYKYYANFFTIKLCYFICKNIVISNTLLRLSIKHKYMHRIYIIIKKIIENKRVSIIPISQLLNNIVNRKARNDPEDENDIFGVAANNRSSVTVHLCELWLSVGLGWLVAIAPRYLHIAIHSTNHQ